MRLNAGSAPPCGCGGPGLAKAGPGQQSGKGVPEGARPGGNGLIDGEGCNWQSSVSHSKGYWPTQVGMQANHDEIMKCQALGMLTHPYSTSSL